jgi:hypothetical protein
VDEVQEVGELSEVRYPTTVTRAKTNDISPQTFKNYV